MSLPPFNPNVRWKDYKIDTPTFELTPVEKPDMSPFLVHMTGKNQIISILKGENASSDLEEGCGFLKSGIPVNSNGNYKAKVVCFTESPTFALDFFRYRKFERWKADQRFGIGFYKANLVCKGIRPAIYTGSELNRQIIYLYNYIQKENHISQNNNLNSCLINLIESVYSLSFPLLEDEPRQGYMWEREWRFIDESGFNFSHDDIRIICCPQEEEKAIQDIIGISANHIQFIRAWREYDDVTNFLERQQQVWQKSGESLEHVEQKEQKIQLIDNLIQQHQIAKNSLLSYQDFVERLIDVDKAKIEKELKLITKRIDDLQAELIKLQKND